MSADVILGDYVKVQGGFAYKSKDFKSSGVPVVKIKNVGTGRLVFEDYSCVDEELAKTTKDFFTKPGDVLISMTGSGPNQPGSLVGRVARVGKKDPLAVINQRVGRLVLKRDKAIDLRFIFYLLSTKGAQEYLVGNSTGSANQANISGKTIESFPFSEVAFEESVKIADILDSLDDKIELNRQINQTLEQIAQTIFKSWFVDFEPVKAKIEAKAAGRDPERAAMCAISGKLEPELDQLPPEKYQQLAATAALFPDELVESELGLIPEGWEPSTIGLYANFQNGYAFKSKDWVDDGFPVVKIGSVKPGLVDLSGGSFVSSETVSGLDAFKLAAGDLLVGMTGYPGETGLVPINDLPPYLNQRVGKVSPLAGKPKYFAWIHANLRGPGFKAFAESSAHGSAQANVSGKLLMEYPVCFPGEPLVVEYHEKFYSFIELFLENNLQIAKLSSIRDSLLPRLLSGEIEVGSLSSETGKAD